MQRTPKNTQKPKECEGINRDKSLPIATIAVKLGTQPSTADSPEEEPIDPEVEEHRGSLEMGTRNRIPTGEENRRGIREAEPMKALSSTD